MPKDNKENEDSGPGPEDKINNNTSGSNSSSKATKGKKGKGRKGGNRRKLERKYGFFHCNECKNGWQSSHVYCIEGTKKVLFKQECQKCHMASNPYKVEDIICSQCGETKCICENKRHIDEKKRHRGDLCLKCRAGWPCIQQDYIEIED